jgi:hypothetical protein
MKTTNQAYAWVQHITSTKKEPREILALKSQLVLLRLAEHAICVYNKEKKVEQEHKLRKYDKSGTKNKIYAMQQDATILHIRRPTEFLMLQCRLFCTDMLCCTNLQK